MLHAPLTLTTAKLDISLLLKSSPTPSPKSSVPTQTPLSRSSSVPLSALHLPPPSQSSQRTSPSSGISVAASQPAGSTPSHTYAQPHRSLLPPLSTPSLYSPSQSSPRHQPQPLAPHLPHNKRPPPTNPHPSASPAKKQSKWTPEEDALIIDLRGSGMKWEDISKRLPGRSAISCRLHYQNYLERRSEWDEERKNRLARLYERLKPDMWGPLAAELGIPWRAAEAMHWQLGEADMARRAGVVPFSLTSTAGPSSLPSGGMLPSGGLHLPYGSDELRPGLGYSVGDSALARPGTSEVEGSIGIGRRSMIETGSRGLSSPRVGEEMRAGYIGRAVLPSMAELERGLTAFDGAITSGTPVVTSAGMGRSAYAEEDRRRGGS
ncbi:hypothetical protein MMC19_004548 [Ptychographa xylographoides]|nr:hypothetical protein [Ptychographa xylographoides]